MPSYNRGCRRFNLLNYIHKSRGPILTFLCLAIILFMIHINATHEFYGKYTENLTKEALQYGAKDPRYSEVYRKKEKLSDNLKYLLLWTASDYAPFYYYGSGQKKFIDNNCPMINCYITDDRNFFGGNLTKFDAIAFNGRNILSSSYSDIPQQRSSNQKYIYFNLESADNYPVCNKLFDGFFNWTATYRLDSDIPTPYMTITNSHGEVVGPKKDLHWDVKKRNIDRKFASKLRNKTKAAAWFVSSCSSRSKRMSYVNRLQNALRLYNLYVDIYGKCGNFSCPKERSAMCNRIVEKDYFFYLSFENSFSEDYITEKVLTGLNYAAVPVVLGGANYSRFLPPDSYLDANTMSPEALAVTMYHTIHNLSLYFSYFTWRDQYAYRQSVTSVNVCKLCEALNNQEMVNKVTIYDQFRLWWQPSYRKRCGLETNDKSNS